MYNNTKINLSSISYKDCYSPGPTGVYYKNFLDTIYDLESDEEIISYFKEFLQLCNKKEIQLMLVCSPMHKKDFYDKCKMDAFWSQIDSLAPDITKLDFSLMFDSDTTYFAESTHLNWLGAEMFTRELIYKIDSIGVLKYNNK